MDELYLMVTISDRNQLRRFLTFYKEYGVTLALITLGRGTAASEVLDSFGLEASEKAVLFAFLTGAEWKQVKRGLQKQMMIDVPGSGIAFIVPMSSVGGKKQLLYLLEGREFEKGEEGSLKDTKNELVVVIANQGHVEQIMEAARSARARGGTVIHARGTNADRAEKFLGVSLATEKEMILMVARREDKNAIMRAIIDQAGLNTPARAVAFSLPVTETAGMRLTDEEEETAASPA